MHTLNYLLNIIGCVAIMCLISCKDTVNPLDIKPVVYSAEELLGISCTFIRFTHDDSKERSADFKLTNNSDKTLMCVRGDILGYNHSGEQIYKFPWGFGRVPLLVEPHSVVTLNGVGYKIPTEVTKIEYVLEEFDARN